jgi:hypothetical protein
MDFDCIVVRDGLAGLTATKDLQSAGKKKLENFQHSDKIFVIADHTAITSQEGAMKSGALSAKKATQLK